jgi:hypothetical protein
MRNENFIGSGDEEYGRSGPNDTKFTSDAFVYSSLSDKKNL